MIDISIIVPVYNVEQYIIKCLDSLLFQETCLIYEIICINDGSTDGCYDIMREYSNKYKNIILINQKNKGLSAARNRGIIESRGKYIIFIDSDDYLCCKNALEILYKECEENELDFAFGDFVYKFEDSSNDYRLNRNKKIVNRVMEGKNLYELGFKTNSIMSVVWNKLYKRDFIIRNNLFFIEGIVYEDMDFTPKVFALSKRVKYIDTCTYAYRQRNNSITNSKEKNIRIGDYLKILDSLYSFNTKYSFNIIKISYEYIAKKIIDELYSIYLSKDYKNLNKYYLNLITDRLFIDVIKCSRIIYRLYFFYIIIIIKFNNLRLKL